jgi:Holliday junction resolvase RusA-like endonuclease
MATTNLIESNYRPNTKTTEWIVRIPLAPVPASRPRVSKWGTYYLKTYATWKKEAERLLGNCAGQGMTERPVRVLLQAIAKRPKRLTRSHPRPDVDNYAKAALDALTVCQCVWKDDDQVIELTVHKRYAAENEEPCTIICIEEIA